MKSKANLDNNQRTGKTWFMIKECAKNKKSVLVVSREDRYKEIVRICRANGLMIPTIYVAETKTLHEKEKPNVQTWRRRRIREKWNRTDRFS